MQVCIDNNNLIYTKHPWILEIGLPWNLLVIRLFDIVIM